MFDAYVAVMTKLAEKKKKGEEKRFKMEQKQIMKEEKAKRREGRSFTWRERLGNLSQFLFFNSGKRQATNVKAGVTTTSTSTESCGEPGEEYLFYVLLHR